LIFIVVYLTTGFRGWLALMLSATSGPATQKQSESGQSESDHTQRRGFWHSGVRVTSNRI
jgi:hypothetical protein